MLLDLWAEAGDAQGFDGEFPDVGQLGEFTSGPVVEFPRGKPIPEQGTPGNEDPRDTGKQAVLGCHPERFGPLGLFVER